MRLNMNDPSNWLNQDALIEHLSEELFNGRLALVLGAGVCKPLNFPDWIELLNRMSAQLGERSLDKTGDPIARAGALRNKHFRNDPSGFCELVKACLYEGAVMDFAEIRKLDLLAAIGALAMASRRGSASCIVTLNFDDILETYLEYHGFSTHSVSSAFHWASNKDITIYHPHGFLPYNETRQPSADIVIGSSEFYKIISSDDKNNWRGLLLTIFRTHTCLYIGLSGSDMHLQSIVSQMPQCHAIKERRIAYNSVFFTKKTDANNDIVQILDGWGVFSRFIQDWSELPEFLFRICQSTSKRM